MAEMDPDDLQERLVSKHAKHIHRSENCATSIDTSADLKRTKPAFKGEPATVNDVTQTFEGLGEITYVPSQPK